LCRLGTGLAAATTGCLGSGGAGGSDGTDVAPSGTSTRTASPSPTAATASTTPPDVETLEPGECDPVRPEPSTPGPDELEPMPYPDLPDDPGADGAESFASAFERAFTTNAVVAGSSTANVPDGIDDIGFSYASVEGRPAGAGYLVDVSFSISYSDDVSDETPLASGETPTPAPTGHTSIAASYYVTERFALRRPGSGGPRVVVACG
jgi:hypothetical protein